jgi:predicted nucleic acid-binding protein
MADRLFLDANVLFSAAYRECSGLLKLWEVPEAQVITSRYAAAEARRNLSTREQQTRLDAILERTDLVDESDPRTIDDEKRLPEKDRPILRAAVLGKATHLITGDFSHFGRFFGERLQGVLIVPPADYLRSRETS